MTPHPPVPESLELLPQSDGDFWFRGLFLDPENFDHRFIIAAVARCAWLDEAERRRTAVLPFEFTPANKEETWAWAIGRKMWVDEALKSADLWKQWGEAK